MKSSKSYDYWRKRQDERLTYSERVSNRTVADIASIYDDSLKRVEEKIENIVGNYAKDIKMDVNSLKELLMQHETDELLKGLYDDLLKTGSNTPKNLEWLRGNYLKRLSREEAIKLQLENERRIVSHHEHRLSEKGYKQTIEITYESLSKDLSGKSGQALNESAKDSMLKKRWVAGQNYSERVWKNTGQLRDEVNTVLNSGLLSGRSSREIINDLAERYGVATYRAETLVRTEMNYFENQTELKSYKDFGVTHYTYLAVRDNRTSEICSTLDGQRFEVEKAEPGLNYPPMHPNCRAGTVPDFDFEDEEEDDYYRVYKNPITGTREKTTKPYEEWLRDIENNAEKKYNVDRDQILSNFDSTNFKTKNKMDRTSLSELINVEDANIVRRYSIDLYKPVNDYLRTNQGSEYIAELAKQLNNAVKKSRLHEDIVVRRGVGGKTLKQLGTDTLGVHELKGLTSTTLDPNISKIFMNSKQVRKVYYEIIVPKGTKAMYVEDLSKYPDEKELLLPHGTKIRVEYIKEKEDYIHVKARIVE